MRFSLPTSISWSAYAIALGSLFTILSQFLPGMSVFFALVWAGYLVYEGIKHRDKIVFGCVPSVFLGLYALFGFYCFLCFFVTAEIGYVAGFFQLLSKSLLMYLVGFIAFSSLGSSKDTLSFILRLYCICSLIYSAWAMKNYFPGLTAWMSNMEYLFASKNSLGQICGVGFLVSLSLIFNEEDKFLCTAQLIIGFFLMITALLFQCRTAVLAVVLGTLFLMVVEKKRAALFIVLALGVICLFLSPSLRSLLAHAFLLDKITPGGDFSSGRFGLWSDSLVALNGHEIFGIGSYYVDNMYIDVLVNVGIVGAFVVLAFWGVRLCLNFYRSFGSRFEASPQKWLINLVAALSLFYLVESLMEGYPPFGPGACSFMFWMLCGYLDAFVAFSNKTGAI